jgi:membrane protease YdiL (CAAX protease family)
MDSFKKERIMNALSSLIKRFPLGSFFVIAFSLTWLGWLVPDMIYAGPDATIFNIAITWAFIGLIAGPLLAAIIVTAVTDGSTGVFALLRKFTIWRAGWGWWLMALLLMPAMALAAIYLNTLFGAPAPTAAFFGTLGSLLTTFAIRLVHPFDGPMQEELGWRGFALPRLQQRYSPLVANLILGVIVAAWHLPLVFTGKLPVFALIATIAATVLYGWLFNNTQGSVLITLVAHAVDGLFIMRDLGLSEADASRLTWLQVGVWAIVAIVVVVIYGPTLVRKQTTPVQTTPIGNVVSVK